MTRRAGLAAAAALCAGALLPAQSGLESWVTTGTTAQQLVAPTGPPMPVARQKGPEAANPLASFADQTVRMVAHVSLGGRRVRVELNMLNAKPLEIGAAHVAVAKAGGENRRRDRSGPARRNRNFHDPRRGDSGKRSRGP